MSIDEAQQLAGHAREYQQVEAQLYGFALAVWTHAAIGDRLQGKQTNNAAAQG